MSNVPAAKNNPTTEEIKALIKDPNKLKQLQEQYPHKHPNYWRGVLQCPAKS